MPSQVDYCICQDLRSEKEIRSLPASEFNIKKTEERIKKSKGKINKEPDVWVAERQRLRECDSVTM